MRCSYSAPLLARPTSQACTQGQIDSPTFRHWCERLKLTPLPHRKIWEYCYILQALAVHGMLEPGRRGLGFGVGTEPITDFLASCGCKITATDQAEEKARAAGWADTNQHAAELEGLRKGFASPDAFDQNVRFQVADMNAVPESFRGYDFTWSACSLEHLGSLANGMRFIERSLQTLKPGGLAVHTTELNCSSDEETMDHDWCVLYRKRDITALAKRLRGEGHRIRLNFHLGDLPNDRFVDVPPYSHDPHLKLRLGEHTTTSYGVIIRRAPATPSAWKRALRRVVRTRGAA